MMAPLLSCEFNMDTACVELKFADGSMISIDCTAVEDEIADNMYQRLTLDEVISLIVHTLHYFSYCLFFLTDASELE